MAHRRVVHRELQRAHEERVAGSAGARVRVGREHCLGVEPSLGEGEDQIFVETGHGARDALAFRSTIAPAPPRAKARGPTERWGPDIIRTRVMSDPASFAPDPVIEVYKKDIDQSLLRRNLTLTVEGRFLQLMELQRFAEELRHAGERARAARR